MSDENEWLLDNEDEDEDEVSINTLPAWKILIVDDEIDMHTATRLALSEVVFENRKLEFISAYSGKEALEVLEKQHDIALTLLDVCMEDEFSGLAVVQQIREVQKNYLLRIVLRTGGQAPEKKIIIDYDINDYKAKTELNSTRLFTTVIAALRSYRDLLKIELNKQQFHILALRSPTGIFQLDVNGVITYANPQWQQMMDEPKLDNSQFDLGHYIHTSDRDKIVQLWKNSLQNHDDFECDFRQTTNRWIHLRANAIHSKENICYGFVGTINDITEYKIIEQKILKSKQKAEFATKEKSEFLAHMTHELRTPLNSIIGYAEMLYDEAALDGEDCSDLKKVAHAGKHLMALINDILDLSKLDAGKMPLEIDAFKVTGLVDDVMVVIKPLADKNNNTITLKYADNIGKIHTDMHRLWQILVNILSNACKFTENDKIMVTVEKKAIAHIEWVIFSIQDQGIGLTEAQQKNLFRPYFQSGLNNNTQAGTGLGLVISQRFCQLMGGKIDIKSEFGKGSLFRIKLPCDLGKVAE